MTQLARIREKLDLIGEKYLTKEVVDILRGKFAPSYTISQLCDTGMVSPLKRWVAYINNINRDIEDPYRIADIYFWSSLYAFGWLGVYQMYGYSTQLIEWYTVYNTQIAWERIIGKTKYIFRKQREGFFTYGCTTAQSGNTAYRVISKERAIIQMIGEWKIFKELPQNIDKKLLLEMAKNFTSKTLYSTIKTLCS